MPHPSDSDWSKRWPAFSPEEIFSPECLRFYMHKLDPGSLDTLQLFREILDRPLLVNHAGATHRGVRSQAENKLVGGAKESMHVAGRAFDITCPDIPSTELYKIAKDWGRWGGIGLYRTFVHVDTRFCDPLNPTTWDYR